MNYLKLGRRFSEIIYLKINYVFNHKKNFKIIYFYIAITLINA